MCSINAAQNKKMLENHDLLPRKSFFYDPKKTQITQLEYGKGLRMYDT